MHLSERQIGRFYDLLDGLIVFANKRLDLVENLSYPFIDKESEMKASFVCDEVWRHPEVIEEYVRQNPHGRKRADLETIESWKDALTSRFILVRFIDDSPVLLSEAGLFAVAGMDEDQSKHLAQCPDSVVTTLLPFEGLIISDGLMYGDNVLFTEADLEYISDAMAEYAPQGVVASAEEFSALVGPFKKRLREMELDELMTGIELEARQMRDGEQLPDGYHRGVLADVPEEDRAQTLKEHLSDGMAAVSARIVRDVVSVQAIEHEPISSLAEYLDVFFKRGEIMRLCKTLGLSGYGHMKKVELIPLYVQTLVDDPITLSRVLQEVEERSFANFRKLVESGGRWEAPLSDYDALTLPDPLFPYSLQFRVGDRLVTLVPDELKPVLDKAFIEDVSWRRERVQLVLNCAEAMVEYYGFLIFGDAYELYQSVVVNAVSEREFFNILMIASEEGFCSFTMDPPKDYGEGRDDYLCYYSLTEWYIRQDLETKCAAAKRQYLAECKGEPDEAMLKKWDEEYDKKTQEEYEALDAYRRRIVEVRSRMERKPLPASAVEGSIFPLLLQLPAVKQLRDFYDAHVPDGEDDYLYADRMVEELICFSFDGGNIDYYLEEVQAQGRNDCAEDPELLLRLIENAWSAFPSWELNGWSSQELVERMSGRKVFYNARGAIAHPSPSDTCPCGSGKPYGECHGGQTSARPGV